MARMIAISAILGLAALTFMFGCAGDLKEPERFDILEENWGSSFRSQRDAQIANPKAGETIKDVDGIQGNPAASAVNKYWNSFKSQEKPKGAITQ